jgi:dTMP kinase
MFQSKGRFFVVEGIDGSGKSTLTRRLSDYMKAQGRDVVFTKEPGASELGKVLRCLVQESKSTIDPYAELLLFAADRAQHMTEVVKPALARGAIVISDRFKYSSLAYQGFGRGLDQHFIAMVNDHITHDVQPHSIFYCKINHEQAFERCDNRGEKQTRFEGAGLEFMQRVSQGFDEIFKNNPKVVYIDAEKTQEEMFNQALHHINEEML